MSDRPTRLSLNELTMPGLELARAAEATAYAGFSGLGVLRATLERLGRERVETILRRAGLVPTSVCVAGGFVQPTAEERWRALSEALTLLEDAAALGCPLVVLAGGRPRGMPVATALEHLRRALASLLGRADELGTEVMLEPLHPMFADVSVVCSLRAARDALGDEIDSGLRLVIDTWHLGWELDLPRQLRGLGRAAGIVHLADWSSTHGDLTERALPGEGTLDFPALLDALHDGGFNGWYEVEVIDGRLAREGARIPGLCARSARRIGLKPAVLTGSSGGRT